METAKEPGLLMVDGLLCFRVYLLPESLSFPFASFSVLVLEKGGLLFKVWGFPPKPKPREGEGEILQDSQLLSSELFVPGCE